MASWKARIKSQKTGWLIEAWPAAKAALEAASAESRTLERDDKRFGPLFLL